MPLIVKPPSVWPPLAAWLRPDNSTDLQRRIVQRALHDDGILETPLGSNRSPYLDHLCTWAGSPLGSYWCAIWVGRMFADAGAKIPQGFPSCDAWLPWLVPLNSVTPQERVGAAVLYGVPGDAKHIGIISRVHPGITLTIEGNRGYAGSSTNNGVAVDQAPLGRKDILGIVLPVPAESANFSDVSVGSSSR
jgi:hypothetical protein